MRRDKAVAIPGYATAILSVFRPPQDFQTAAVRHSSLGLIRGSGDRMR